MDGKRILLYTDNSQLKGGAEEQLRREQAYLSELGNAVRSVGIGDGTGDAFTDEVIADADSGVVREIAGLTVSATVYRHLRRVIREFRPDVAHIHKSQKYPATVALAVRDVPALKTHHDYSTVCPSAWAVKQDTYDVCECGIGAKCWRHGCRSLPVILGYYLPRHKIQKPIEKRLIDRHVAPSARLTEYLRTFGYEAQQIRNPESVRDDTETSDEGYFLFIGRLSEEKGVDMLVAAAERLTERHIPIKIAGSGPLESDIERRLRSADCDNVELLGYVPEDEKSSLYAGARAVIIPSVWMENYPTVVLEAMAHGKPVIGSDRGGIGEMVEHDQRGLLYPARDPDQLAAHIERLADSESEAKAMGNAGRKWVREHSNQELFGRKICGVFQELADSEPRGTESHPPSAE